MIRALIVFILLAPFASSCISPIARDSRPPMKPGQKRKRDPNPPGAPQPQPPERDRKAELAPTTAAPPPSTADKLQRWIAIGAAALAGAALLVEKIDATATSRSSVTP